MVQFHNTGHRRSVGFNPTDPEIPGTTTIRSNVVNVPSVVAASTSRWQIIEELRGNASFLHVQYKDPMGGTTTIHTFQPPDNVVG